MIFWIKLKANLTFKSAFFFINIFISHYMHCNYFFFKLLYVSLSFLIKKSTSTSWTDAASSIVSSKPRWQKMQCIPKPIKTSPSLSSSLMTSSINISLFITISFLRFLSFMSLIICKKHDLSKKYHEFLQICHNFH